MQYFNQKLVVIVYLISQGNLLVLVRLIKNEETWAQTRTCT